MKKTIILTSASIMFASFALAQTETKEVRAMPMQGKPVQAIASQGAPMMAQVGQQNVMQFMTTGDKAVDEKLAVLMKERDEKLKAIQEEYQAKIKNLMGDKKLMPKNTSKNMPQQMATGTRPAQMQGNPRNMEGRGEGQAVGRPAPMGMPMMQREEESEGSAAVNKVKNVFRGMFNRE